MPISLKADQTPVLTAAQVDANWTSVYGLPAALTISSGAITVNGTGTYRISPESGTSDSVTSIAGATRVGDEICLLNQTVGHTITYVHASNLHLTADFSATTIYSIIKLKCVLMSPMTWVELSRSHNV